MSETSSAARADLTNVAEAGPLPEKAPPVWRSVLAWLPFGACFFAILFTLGLWIDSAEKWREISLPWTGIMASADGEEVLLPSRIYATSTLGQIRIREVPVPRRARRGGYSHSTPMRLEFSHLWLVAGTFALLLLFLPTPLTRLFRKS